MVWTTMQETGLTGIDGMLLYASSLWAGFIPLTLFVLFLIVLLGSYFSQVRTRGYGDFWASFTVAGIFDTFIVVIMSLITQTVGETTYRLAGGVVISAVIAVTIVGVIVLFTSRDKE